MSVTKIDITDENEYLHFATLEDNVLFMNVRSDSYSLLELKKVGNKASLRNYLQISLPSDFIVDYVKLINCSAEQVLVILDSVNSFIEIKII